MPTITRITDLDVAALQRLRVESLQEGFRFMERLCHEWASGANRFDAPGEALFLAVADDQVTGICGLNRDPYARDARAGRVRRLYVLPDHRRRSVGHALLQAVIAYAQGHFDILRVRTNEAGEFYTRHGFQCITSQPDTTHVFELIPADNLFKHDI